MATSTSTDEFRWYIYLNARVLINFQNYGQWITKFPLFRSPIARRDSWLLFGKVDTISRMNEIDTTHFTWGMLIIFCQRSHKHDWIFRVKGILLCSFHNMTFSFIHLFFLQCTLICFWKVMARISWGTIGKFLAASRRIGN